MTVQLLRYSPEEWKEYAEASHKVVFNEIRSPDMDRISYAILAYDEAGVLGYVTCRELDSESIYWQYGGVVEGRRGHAAFRTFQAMFNQMQQQYKRISTYVENSNVGYLHMLMKLGFRVIGLRVFKDKVYLELFISQEI